MTVDAAHQIVRAVVEKVNAYASMSCRQQSVGVGSCLEHGHHAELLGKYSCFVGLGMM